MRCLLAIVATATLAHAQAKKELSISGGPLGNGDPMDRTEPPSDGSGNGAADSKLGIDNGVPAGPTAEQLRTVRHAAFIEIDKTLGIDTAALLQERLKAVGATGPLAGAPAGGAGAAGKSVITKLLKSDKLDMILNLLPIGNQADLIKGIIAIAGKAIAGKIISGGKESTVESALTPEDIEYMQKYPDDIRKALTLELKKREAVGETATQESTAAEDAQKDLLELERLRTESAAAAQDRVDADKARVDRDKMIRDLEAKLRAVRP
jgi:hypothetical protein